MPEHRLTRKQLQYYPNLKDESYSVTSDQSKVYNCAAWIFGDQTRRWWPHPDSNDYYWPAGFRREETLQAFEEYLLSLGYEVCESGDVEPDFLKVVVYADKWQVPTHVGVLRLRRRGHEAGVRHCRVA
jgi:hypothetical protein